MSERDALVAREVVSRLERVVAGSERRGLHEPVFSGNEVSYLRDAVNSGYVSTAGEFVKRFEDSLREIIGVSEVFATSSGTAALELALIGSGVGPGDEVILPSFTFVATANAVSHVGADPHFVDIDSVTLGISPSRLRELLDQQTTFTDGLVLNSLTGKRIAAIVPMHTFGSPVNLRELMEIAREFRVPVVEDAAEALGSNFGGRPAGSFGLASAISFNGNKIVTTGGGGLVATNDSDVGTLVRHLGSTAKVPHPYHFIHDRVGFNYRMPALNAALGLAQVERLDHFLESKARLHQQYVEAFSDFDEARVFEAPPASSPNHWLNALVFEPSWAHVRDLVCEIAARENVGVRPPWNPLHRLPMYADMQATEMSVTTEMFERVLTVPSSAGIV